MNFDENIAKELGVECAILLSNIEFWVKKNKANAEERHFHDELWWTYNTAGSFAKLFPWWSERNIYRFLKKLEEAGYIKSGNFNKFKYDRTKWYTSDTEKSLIKPIRQKRQMDSTKLVNGFANLADGFTKSGGPIPDINTNKKQEDINSYTSNDWQAIVFSFYAKISPETPISSRFSKTVKEGALNLLSMHSKEEIESKIDDLASSADRKFVTRFEAFCNKYSTIKSKPKPIVVPQFKKPAIDDPREIAPDF